MLFSLLNHIGFYIPIDDHLVVTLFPQMNHISGEFFYNFYCSSTYRIFSKSTSVLFRLVVVLKTNFAIDS
jgi:hypothetical protein